MKYTSKDFDKLCAVCEHAREICDEDNMLCEVRGIVGKSYRCKKFIYDPLKRIPPKAQKIAPVELVSLDEEDSPEDTQNTAQDGDAVNTDTAEAITDTSVDGEKSEDLAQETTDVSEVNEDTEEDTPQKTAAVNETTDKMTTAEPSAEEEN